jgi:polyisoprenoid-binding protein YceI
LKNKFANFHSRANQSFSLGNSSCCHSAGAPATEESVFSYSRSQILQSLRLYQDDASLFKSTHLETLTCPDFTQQEFVMTRLLALTMVAAFAFSANLNAAEKLKLDAEKSKIGFVGSKPDKSSHKGGFKKFEAEVLADFEAPENSSIKILIKTESIWSDNPKLTGHLKNADFFDIRKYPEATFVSSKIEAEEEGQVIITGKLKMLGKAVEVKIPFETEVSDDGLKMSSKFKIDRTKWGMNYGAPDKINSEVEMSVELHLTR